MKRFKDQTVVITGGNKGIGFAIAERFAQEGANVVIASVEPQVEEAAKALSKTGSRVIPAICDVTDSAAVKAMYDLAEDTFGDINVSVQNAGIITIAKVEDLTEKEWDATMDVNTKGVFLCCQEAIRRMRKSGKGGRSSTPRRGRRGTASSTRRIMLPQNSGSWA